MAWGKVKAEDFIGKEAHVGQRELSARRAHVHADRRGPHVRSGVKRYMLGGEPILTPDGGPITTPRAGAPT